MLSDSICFIPPKVKNPQKAIIMLHGFGSNGYDLISMAPFISDNLPDTVFYSPDAPFAMPETGGFKWFDIEADASTDFFTHFDYLQTCFVVINLAFAVLENFDLRNYQNQHHQ